MISKSFDAIEKTDIEALIQNQVREGRSIEYKTELPGKLDDDKREFLADVSSFANAGGGDLLYGVTAVAGVPKEASGLRALLDAEMLRLENLVRDGVDPRIPGIRMNPVEGFSQGPILVIRVPRSWAAPHMITLKNLSRFFTRNSAGKHQMGVTEIRAAFQLSGTLLERIKRFRDERLGRIIADETPAPLEGSGKLVLHILPIASFGTGFQLETSVLRAQGSNLRPIGGGSWSQRFNLDGFLTYAGAGANTPADAYCQLFRAGQIESVWSNLLSEDDGNRYIPSVAYEEYVVDAVVDYFRALTALQVPGPLSLHLNMVGVSGAYMYVGARYRARNPAPIDRDTLILPDVLVEDIAAIAGRAEAGRLLRPAFDAVWNACGFPHSLNYDQDGNWRAHS